MLNSTVLVVKQNKVLLLYQSWVPQGRVLLRKCVFKQCHSFLKYTCDHFLPLTNWRIGALDMISTLI